MCVCMYAFTCVDIRIHVCKQEYTMTMYLRKTHTCIHTFILQGWRDITLAGLPQETGLVILNTCMDKSRSCSLVLCVYVWACVYIHICVCMYVCMYITASKRKGLIALRLWISKSTEVPAHMKSHSTMNKQKHWSAWREHVRVGQWPATHICAWVSLCVGARKVAYYLCENHMQTYVQYGYVTCMYGVMGCWILPSHTYRYTYTLS
jgi:hypothetical protein